jgi:FMN-binding domain
MKPFVVLLVVVLLATATLSAAEESWVGRIYVRESAALQDKYTFYWEFNGSVYGIANPNYPGIQNHQGHTVKLYGTLKDNYITVSKLETVQPIALLQRLFPAAGWFSTEEGDPPHFKVYAADPRKNPAAPLMGFAFWTADIVPDERGYHGPIFMLVGMNTTGILTGVIVVEDSEPYGDRSVERPAFPAQFKGKSIRAPFRVGGDVDAVSGASISIASATRAIRDSARIIAMKYLTPEAVK